MVVKCNGDERDVEEGNRVPTMERSRADRGLLVNMAGTSIPRKVPARANGNHPTRDRCD